MQFIPQSMELVGDEKCSAFPAVLLNPLLATKIISQIEDCSQLFQLRKVCRLWDDIVSEKFNRLNRPWVRLDGSNSDLDTDRVVKLKQILPNVHPWLVTNVEMGKTYLRHKDSDVLDLWKDVGPFIKCLKLVETRRDTFAAQVIQEEHANPIFSIVSTIVCINCPNLEQLIVDDDAVHVSYYADKLHNDSGVDWKEENKGFCKLQRLEVRTMIKYPPNETLFQSVEVHQMLNLFPNLKELEFFRPSAAEP